MMTRLVFPNGQWPSAMSTLTISIFMTPHLLSVADHGNVQAVDLDQCLLSLSLSLPPHPSDIQAVDIEQCLGEGESCRNQDDAPSYGETVCR